VFTAPRYHTNQIPAVKALKERGCTVDYLVLYAGPSEDHSLLTPVVLGDGAVFRAVRWLLGRTGAVDPEDDRDFRIRWGCPPAVRFWRELKRLDADAVVVRLAALPFAALALVFARLRGAKPVVYSQEPAHGPSSRRRRLFARIVRSLFGACWITPVQGDPERYPLWGDQVFYVPFVAEPDLERGGRPVPSAGSDVSPFKILCIGKFQRRKNLPLMVDAFAKVCAVTHARLTVVGECSSAAHQEVLDSVRERIRAVGVEELVEVRTNLPYEEVQDLYASHDVFVLPSSKEAAAVSVLEAMAHGLPVICSDSNGTSTYIEPGGNGYVFRRDDAHDLARVLELVLSGPETIARMGRRSVELVTARHSPERYYEMMMAIIAGTAEARHA
jgi:glycosyltransferase involved in cell wall biosynthesis